MKTIPAEKLQTLINRWDSRLSAAMKDFERIPVGNDGRDVARARVGEIVRCITELENIVKGAV